MNAPKPGPPKKKDEAEISDPHKRKRSPKTKKPSQPAKKVHAVADHLTHRPFVEALTGFFKKETN